MSDILFTGYPGFLGSALLPLALKRRPDATAICVIQDRFRPVAERKLAAQTAENPEIEGRVRLISGDITQTSLGMADKDLANVSEVFHLAAVYDLAVAPELAWKVNVEGTQNVLDVVNGLDNFTRLQYVSTCYVSGRYDGVYKETDLDKGQPFQNHYEETKFEAEVLVRKAMDAGLPGSIYRPGIVVGDSQTGETQKFDGPYYLAHLLSIQPKLAVIPQVADPDKIIFGMVPRDYVIGGIDALSTLDDAVGKTYALTDPNAPSVRHLVDTFADLLNRKVTWVRVPLRLGKTVVGRVPGVEHLLGVPEESLDYFAFPTIYDTTQAVTDLAKVGFSCTPFDEYAPNLIRFYKENPDISSAAMV